MATDAKVAGTKTVEVLEDNPLFSKPVLSNSRLLFIVSILLFWLLLHGYACVRIWQALAPTGVFKIGYVVVCILLSICLPISMFLGMNSKMSLSFEFISTLRLIGSIWMVYILYSTLCFLLVDIFRVIHYIKPFFPTFSHEHLVLWKRIAFLAMTLSIAIVMISGYIRYLHPRETRVMLTTRKSLHHWDGHQINILFFSDLHLNAMMSKTRLQAYVQRLTREPYDILIVGGDLLDGDKEAWIARDFAGILKPLIPARGAFAVMGNHEYYMEKSASVAFIKESGFTLLRDSSCYLPGLIIAGREDASQPTRAPLSRWFSPTDSSFMILVDHQPTDIEADIKAGADLVLCGHTHAGQLFPLTAIIGKIWKFAYGYAKMGQSDIVVSSGLGLWGPPFRIGSRSEWVRITIAEEK
ncbi:MAG: metallophosphoesterase [Bacteroidales bacterium]|nr:metallophosphoesterase [Bacteroidales bacterium]